MSGCEKSDVCPAFAARSKSPLTLAIYICLAIAVGAVIVLYPAGIWKRW